MAKVNDQKVLAAGDGWIIEFNTESLEQWQETKRWNNFDGDSFGSEIHINTDEEHLWVSDTDQHRVICFDKVGKLQATFGTKNQAGTDLQTLTSPTSLFGRKGRLIVFDQGNQRLVKIEVK
jgi:6-phosphogluconolactonase (cycloisomerase 2 family)